MRSVVALVLVCCLSPLASARTLGRLELARLDLRAPVAAPLLPSGLGGGDGVVTGPVRTLGWVLAGTGALVGAGGLVALKVEHDDHSSYAVGTALVAAGGVALLAGAILIWTTGCVSCASCGVVERDDPRPPARAVAGKEADASDLALALPAFGGVF